jgi:hypothetical protein
VTALAVAATGALAAEQVRVVGARRVISHHCPVRAVEGWVTDFATVLRIGVTGEKLLLVDVAAARATFAGVAALSFSAARTSATDPAEVVSAG